MSSGDARVTYRFGDFEVDTAACELRRGGRRIPLTRQPMDCLILLLERRQELVSREEIAKRLWAEDVFTDPDAGIHTAILRIRQAFGDSRATPRYRRNGARTRLSLHRCGRGRRASISQGAISHSPQPPSRAHELRGAPEGARGIAGSGRVITAVNSGRCWRGRKNAAGLAARGQRVNEFPDGVWLVDLNAASVPGLIPQTIATVLGIRETLGHSVRDACSTICATVRCCSCWTTAST